MAECKHKFAGNYVTSDIAYTQVGLLSYLVTGTEDLAEIIAKENAAKLQAQNLKKCAELASGVVKRRRLRQTSQGPTAKKKRRHPSQARLWTLSVCLFLGGL